MKMNEWNADKSDLDYCAATVAAAVYVLCTSVLHKKCMYSSFSRSIDAKKKILPKGERREEKLISKKLKIIHLGEAADFIKTINSR